MITEIVCENCEYETGEETTYCPECGEEEPWSEEPKFEFDESDLPVTFAVRAYDDNWGLWHGFCDEYFGERLHGEDIAGIPDEEFPSMKFHEVELYWALTENYEVVGPYLREQDAEQAALEELDNSPDGRPPA